MDTVTVTPRSVDAERGLAWIGEAWRLFTARPLPWVLLGLLMMGLSIVCSLLPVVGGLLGMFLNTLMSAGLMLAARAQQRGGEPSVQEFLGILSHPALQPLLVVTLIAVALAVAVAALSFGATVGGGLLAAIGVVFGGDAAAGAALVGAMLLGFLLFLALTVPILALYWFAVPLVLFRGVAPWEAMRLSFSATLANMLPLLVYGVVALLVLLLGLIPFTLGLIVVVPVLGLSWLASCDDVFPGASAEGAARAPEPIERL